MGANKGDADSSVRIQNPLHESLDDEDEVSVPHIASLDLSSVDGEMSPRTFKAALAAAEQSALHEMEHMIGQDTHKLLHSDMGAIMAETIRQSRLANEGKEQSGFYGNSLGVFGPRLRFRIACMYIVQHKIFSGFILALIFANTVVLAIQGPNNELSESTNKLFNAFDLVVTVLFTIEMILRIIGLGFVRGPRTYLKDAWNVLDFVVVVSAWLTIIVDWMGESGNQSFSTLRSLRAARPLRQLRSLRFLSMTVVILESLGLSRKVVTPVFSLALLIFAIFAILGIPLFRGLLSRECEAPILGGTETTCPDGLQCTDTEICVERKFVWTDASLRLTHNTQELVDPTGFDNIFSAIATLWIAISLDGNMHEIPQHMIETGTAAGWLVWPYFMILVVLVVCWVVHLYGAVITSVFREVSRRPTEEKEKEALAKVAKNAVGKGLLTVINTADKATLALHNSVHKKNEVNRITVLGENLLSSNIFQNGIMGVIIANVFIMSLEHDGMTEVFSDWLFRLNNTCTVIFTIELVMKISTFGFFKFIEQPINVFDGSIVVGSVLGWILAEANGAQVGRLVRSFRLFRVGRIARILIRTETVRMLLAAVLSSWQAVFNLFFLTVFAIVLFAILGMHFLHSPDEEWTDLPVRNFSSFSDAGVAVFHLIMQADWTITWFQYIEKKGWITSVFFIVAFSFVRYILQNLYLACLISNYAMSADEQLRRQKDHLRLELRERSVEFASDWHLQGSSTEYKPVVDDNIDLAGHFPGANGSIKNKSPLDELNINRAIKNQNPMDKSKDMSTGPENDELRPYSGELMLETANRKWVSRWVTLDSGFLGLYTEDSGSHISTIPLSHVAFRASTKSVRADARLAFRVDVGSDAMIEGVRITKLVFDPITEENKQGWLQALAKQRSEGEFVQRRRAVTVTMHNIIKRQDNVLTYVESRKQKQIVMVLEQEEEFDDRNANDKLTINASMGDFHRFNEKSFFDINVDEIFLVEDFELEKKSIGIFSLEMPFRKLCINVVESASFELFVSLIILLSMLAVAAEGPPNAKHSTTKEAMLFVSDVTFLTIFWCEFMVKVIALGFVVHPDAYLRDNWNQFDFFLICFQSVDVMLAGNGAFGKALRAGRILRCFRLIRRAKGIQAIISVMGKTAKDLSIVMLLIFVFFLIFSIFGMDQWMGKFKECRLPHTCQPTAGIACFQRRVNLTARFGGGVHMNVTCKEECVDIGGLWENPGFGFDNVFHALYTLVMFALTTDRSVIFSHALDIHTEEKGIQPSTANFNTAAFYYFLIFQLVVVMFFMNLFVVVLIRNLHNLHGTSLLTPLQLHWAAVKRKLHVHMSATDARPMWAGGPSWLTEPNYHIVTTKRFNNLIFSLIITNLVVNMMEHFPMEAWQTEASDLINFVFLILFTIEMTMKVFAMGLPIYLCSRWDQFDCTIVLISWLTMWFSLSSDSAQSARGFRSLRALARSLRGLRGLRLLRPEGPLAIVVNTLMLGFGNVVNVSTVFLFNTFVFATLGMQLFGDHPHGEYFNQHSNFDSFGDGLVFLFKVAFGQHFLRAQEEVGSEDWRMYGFLIAYQITTSFLIMHQYTAAIFEAFDLTWTPPNANTITTKQIHALSETWDTAVKELGHYESLSAIGRRQMDTRLRDIPLPDGKIPELLERCAEAYGVSRPHEMKQETLQFEDEKGEGGGNFTPRGEGAWESRWVVCRDGRLSIFTKEGEYSDDCENAIISIPCDQVEVHLPHKMRNEAPYAFKLKIDETVVENGDGPSGRWSNIIYNSDVPLDKMVLDPGTLQNQHDWIDVIMRSRNNYFQWLHTVRSNLEFDRYVRHYCGRDSSLAEALAEAHIESAGGRLDGSLARSKSEDVRVVQAEEDDANPTRPAWLPALKDIWAAILTASWVEEATELPDDILDSEDPVTYEELALGVCLHFIGPDALTIHSRVERDAFLQIYISNKIIATTVRHWLARKKVDARSNEEESVMGAMVGRKKQGFAIKCAAWWRFGLLADAARKTRQNSMLSCPDSVEAVASMVKIAAADTNEDSDPNTQVEEDETE